MRKIVLITTVVLFTYSQAFSQSGESEYKSLKISKDVKLNNLSLPTDKLNGISIKSISASDIDLDIPNSNQQYSNKFALIVGNEDYSSFQSKLNSEVNVEFAESDATIFKEYAIKTLGIPEENIIFKINAKSIELNKMIEKIALIAKSSQGDAEIYFYYAGHGFPNIETREPYLIPVDCGGDDLNYAIKLSSLYKKLSESESKRVVVFLDACFSGGARNTSLLAARGVRIKPKDDGFMKNIVVFSATSEDQPALAWKDKGHGMFTYFLLKKIQETSANVNYGELYDYISKNVGIKSALINEREQSPKVNVGVSVQSNWRNIKLK